MAPWLFLMEQFLSPLCEYPLGHDDKQSTEGTEMPWTYLYKPVPIAGLATPKARPNGPGLAVLNLE